MLFNSYLFIFLFFPIALLGYYRFTKANFSLSLYWLAGCSLFFYGWWNPKYLILLLFSITVNFAWGHYLENTKSKTLLAAGIVFNLGLLAYFKYFNFFVENIVGLFHYSFVGDSIILPLAISFFTFQQIAYLVDLYQGKIQHLNLLQYILFISFFPQLIAGPIVHQQEMMPQFKSRSIWSNRRRNISIGLTIFAIGLFKKVALADSIAPFATQVFQASEAGMLLTPLEAWLGALAYTFQLYFDFSGYSDMALGLARCFGIRLPLNFHSPYKATSITEFWRRWHMTLSRFLRDYLYIPLGGNRKGPIRRYTNLMITMILGGLWHGAGWTFMIWGMLHGAYLVINHAWQSVMGEGKGQFRQLFGMTLTFLAVVIAWVFFKSQTLSGAWHFLKCMFNFQGELLPSFWGRHVPMLVEWGVRANGEYANPGHAWLPAIGWMLLMTGIIWILPNTQQFMRYYRPTLQRVLAPAFTKQFFWRPNLINATGLALLTIFAFMSMNKISEFLYYQF